MKEHWIWLQDAYAELVLRERILVLCAVAGALYGGFDFFLLHPLDTERDLLRDKLKRSTEATQQLDGRAGSLAEEIKKGLHPNFHREEQDLKQQIATMNEQIERRMASMIPPAQVTKMLEELLANDRDLRLISLGSLKPSSPTLNPGDGNDPMGQGKPEFYRHGFAIELEGSYLAALQYLESLESLPWDLSWDHITYEVTNYPRARVVIELHTVSREENWIGV